MVRAFALLWLLLAAPGAFATASAQDDGEAGAEDTAPSTDEAPPDAPPAGEGATPAGDDAPAAEGAADAAPEEPAKAPEKLFEEGVAAYKSGAEGEAARLLYQYLDGNDPTADQYEWAEYFLAKNFERMGLTHAAVEYLYNVIKEQKRPEILPDALRSLELIMTTKPYDEETLVVDLLASSEFGTLPPDVRTFIEFHQGRRDLLQQREKWSQRHFQWLAQVDEAKSPLAVKYIQRAIYAEAITTLTATHDKSSQKKREQREEALKKLAEVADSKDLDFELRNDAWRTVARLHFEEGRYKEALESYNKIEVPFLSREEANLFLEKAWSRYYAGDFRGTLGILLSLDAPSYRRYFKPERFILKALAYQGLCHYAAAKGASREFLRRYGSNLNQLKQSRDPLTDPVIRRAAVQRRGPKRVLKYLRSLQRERTVVQGLDNGPLKKHLARIYDLKIKEVVRKLERIVKDEAQAVAEELLDYEEQARLLDYEISLEVFRRVKSGEQKKVVDFDEPIPLGSKQVYYQFNGEYWNDELHNYRFRIDNRCFGERLFQ